MQTPPRVQKGVRCNCAFFADQECPYSRCALGFLMLRELLAGYMASIIWDQPPGQTPMGDCRAHSIALVEMNEL